MKLIVISQNVILGDLKFIKRRLRGEDVVLLSTHKLFSNEIELLNNIFSVKKCYSFADLLSDHDMECCDVEAYNLIENKNHSPQFLITYYDKIKEIKNTLVYERIAEQETFNGGFLCDDSLGIDKKVWTKRGLRLIKTKRYYVRKKPSIYAFFKRQLSKFRPLMFLYRFLKRKKTKNLEVYVSEYNSRKLIFIGSMNKILYRTDVKWQNSPEEAIKFANHEYYESENAQYLSTLHEWGKCSIPDNEKYDVRFIQDGYLPPNYSSRYLKFVPNNVKFYAWDALGEEMFKNQNIDVSILPFRKKIYMRPPVFHKIKKILVVTSGAGDWTAIKNRSDEDLMVECFGKLARLFPDITFVYRCHPVWIHPDHQGVNSINRVVDYFKYLGLKNIQTSSNIVKEDLENFKLSLPRQSLDADLENTDLVIGEHSIAMIDAAIKGIPFASMNLTNRRNLFCGISDLGFPHFESADDLASFILSFNTNKSVEEAYLKAVKKYNEMTDIE